MRFNYKHLLNILPSQQASSGIVFVFLDQHLQWYKTKYQSNYFQRYIRIGFEPKNLNIIFRMIRIPALRRCLVTIFGFL